MKKSVKPICLLFSFLFLLTITLPSFAAKGKSNYEADENGGLTFENFGKKEAISLGKPGEYEIAISVPGNYNADLYDEIVVMVDASLSQGGNFGKLKELIHDLAVHSLADSKNMKLTFMGFGIGPKTAGSFYTVEQVDAFLATATQDDLLQGRSATNCEVGFTYVNEYLNNSPNLKKAFVLYTSDGSTNLDESPLDWSKWYDPTAFDLFRNYTEKQVANYVISNELEHIYSGNKPISATSTLFPAECAGLALAAEKYGMGSTEHIAEMDKLSEAMSNNSRKYISTLLQHVFQVAGLSWDEPQSASDVEKAFMIYFGNYPGTSDALYSSYMDTYYLILGDTGPKLQKNKIERIVEASKALQNNPKTQCLYHIGYSNADDTWMNIEKGYFEDTSKLKYVYAESFSDVVDDLEYLGKEIVSTVYENVSITDPMSEYVILDPDTIRICFDDEVIYRYGEGWLTDLQPTSTDPISISTNAQGNQEITWLIKDGPLYNTDRYSLHYHVRINKDAPGFQYGQEYPANAPTYGEYIDPNGVLVSNDIAVPTVVFSDESSVIPEDGYGITITKQDKTTGKTISGIEFSLYKVPSGEGTVSSKPTDEEVALYAKEKNLAAVVSTDINGYSEVPLERGVYLVIESPNNKVKAPVAPFYVTLPGVDPITKESVRVVSVYPKNELKDEEPPGPDIPEEPNPSDSAYFSIVKHHLGEETAVLKGAEFQVLRQAEEGESGTPYAFNGEEVELVPVVVDGSELTLTTNSEGVAISPKLTAGLYFLLETKAPFNYKLEENVLPVYATIDGNKIEGTKIANTPIIPILPSTGGIGTGIFIGVGLSICLLAALLLIAKKRSSRKYEYGI